MSIGVNIGVNTGAASDAFVSLRGKSRASVLESVHAEGSVKGLLFELKVEQRYRNAGATNIEAVYSFPVPWNAVLLDVEFTLGERVLRGTVTAKADGERQYERALEEGDTAVMVERAADGVYTVNVGNLLPGEAAVVRFRYAQLLTLAQGQVRLVVPTVIGPRYGDAGAIGMQPHQVPVTDLLTRHAFTLELELHGELARGRLASPSHALALRRTDSGVHVSPAAEACLDRDFVLAIDGLAATSFSTVGRDGRGYVALASFCPATTGAARPLGLKILVDCSGSMNGDRIDAARTALHQVLSHLDIADSFSFSRFGSAVEHCTRALMAATPRAIAKAGGWVSDTRADMGGTDIRQALLSTFELGAPVAADVLLVTDGDVWEADELVALAERAGQRVFAVGIGSAPASSLLHMLAIRSGGACELIADPMEADGAIRRMVKRMRQAPVRNAQVRWDGEARWQADAGPLFNGETAHHFAGFFEAAPGSAVLAWCDPGSETPQCAELRIHGDIIEGDTLARVAAAARMRDADARTRHALAMEYGLVGATTNLVLTLARADGEKQQAMPALERVAQALPAGWGGAGVLRTGTYSAPAVWSRGDTAMMVSQRQAGYDTPVMFRRQALLEADPYPNRARMHAFVEHLGDQSVSPPGSLDELEGALPPPLVNALRDLVAAGYGETAVVQAVLHAIRKRVTPRSLLARLSETIGSFGKPNDTPDECMLAIHVEKIVRDAYDTRTATSWDEEIPSFLRKRAD